MRSACRLWSKRRPCLRKGLVERMFASVAERRMPDVVDQRQRLGEILVQPQRLGDGPGDLRYFRCVRQTAAKMVGVAIREDLRLARKTTKRASMNNARAVSLKS